MGQSTWGFPATSKMVYTRFVEIGRVAYIAFGPDNGKLVAIVDVIDQSKALVDGPCSGVARRAISFKHLHLTDHVIKIGPSARKGSVIKAWEKAEITQKWESSTWAKKIVNRQKRVLISDFERFKLMKAKQTRNRLINIEYKKLQEAAKKAGPKAGRVNRKPHLKA